MRMRYRSSGSQGQLLLIVAFGMITLLAIGAIVVDLGLSWMLRRHEQNAADPASIAAARYIEEGDSLATRNKMRTAACFYAKQNGFFTSDDALCSTADTQLRVEWPPVTQPFEGNMGMVEVIISENHPSFFGQFFGEPQATVTTRAIAARESTSANSNALVALDPESCKAGSLFGNGDITIAPVENPETGDPYSGGYVQVNSSCNPGALDDACSSGSGAFWQGGNAGAEIIAPHIYIHGTCGESGGDVTSPITEGHRRAPDPMAGLGGPRQQVYPHGFCPVVKKIGGVDTITYEESLPTSDGCKFNRNGMTAEMLPGVYFGGWTFSGKDVTIKLHPGIYIIAGGGIRATGDATIDTIGGDPSTDPARLLIFSTDNTTDPSCSPLLARCVQGEISLSGQGGLRMWGLDSGPWKGLLMWQDGEGSNPSAPIKITGSGEMNIAGTIYAPKALVRLEGNGVSTAILSVQIISWQWEVGGGGNLYMPYDPSQLYHFVQQGLVH